MWRRATGREAVGTGAGCVVLDGWLKALWDLYAKRLNEGPDGNKSPSNHKEEMLIHFTCPTNCRQWPILVLPKYDLSALHSPLEGGQKAYSADREIQPAVQFPEQA